MCRQVDGRLIDFVSACLSHHVLCFDQIQPHAVRTFIVMYLTQTKMYLISTSPKKYNKSKFKLF